jgi:DNA-binding response OmpR family regulator
MQKAVTDRYTITVDDDPMMAKIIEKATGIASVALLSPENLISRIRHKTPVAVFVDINLGLSAKSGLQLIPELRNYLPFCPILVITSDPSANAVREALSLGADDFVRKPIDAIELTSRLQARLYDQAKKEHRSIKRYGDIALNVVSRCLKGNKQERYLTPTATTILVQLIEADGTLVMRDTLKAHSWSNVHVTDNALDRRIHELRRALAEVSRSIEIESVYGQGFRLKAQAATKRAS